MNDTQRHTLLRLARETIIAAVQQSEPPHLDTHAGDVSHEGVFVTIRVAGRLRGCMGNLDRALPIDAALQRAATLVVTSDRRFPPLQPDELRELSIEIHVLTAFERVTGVEDIEPGVHGVVIEHAGRRGLLLPGVATEHGMTASEFLDAVCTKAALPERTWKDSGVQLHRFLDECFIEPA